jgi:hypothetical protein
MFCSNCGNRIDDNSLFCSNCGVRIVKNGTEAQSASPPRAVQQSHVLQERQPMSPPPASPINKSNKVLKGCLVGGMGTLGVLIMAIVCLYMFNSDFREAFDEGYEGAYEKSFNKMSGIQYSKLSTYEQEVLMNDLYQRLDDYFLSILTDEEQLMQLFIVGAMGDDYEAVQEKMFEKMYGDKLISICEQWVSDNNIDAENWESDIDENEFIAGYLLHLMRFAMNELEHTD